MTKQRQKLQKLESERSGVRGTTPSSATLDSLIAMGHGSCLQAIRLVPDEAERLRKLREYVKNRPDNKTRRRAAKLLAELEAKAEAGTK